MIKAAIETSIVFRCGTVQKLLRVKSFEYKDETDFLLIFRQNFRRFWRKFGRIIKTGRNFGEESVTKFGENLARI